MYVIILRQQMLTVLTQYVKSIKDDTCTYICDNNNQTTIIQNKIFWAVIMLNWLLPYLIIACWSINKQRKAYNERKKEEEDQSEFDKEKGGLFNYRIKIEFDKEKKICLRSKSLQRTKLTIFLTIIMIIVSPLLLIVVSQYWAYTLEADAYNNSEILVNKETMELEKIAQTSRRGFQTISEKNMMSNKVNKKNILDPITSEESTGQNIKGVCVISDEKQECGKDDSNRLIIAKKRHDLFR